VKREGAKSGDGKGRIIFQNRPNKRDALVRPIVVCDTEKYCSF